MKTFILMLLGAGLITGCFCCFPETTLSEEPLMLSKDFSYTYWLNGWRKHTDDRSADILCFETGYYGFTLDVDDLTKAGFSRFSNETGYLSAFKAGSQRISSLESAELTIEMETGGKVYRAVSCRAGVTKGIRHLESARLWESGRFVQHFDLQGLILKDPNGVQLKCEGILNIVAWPQSLTLTAKIAPVETDSGWVDSKIRIKLKTEDQGWQDEYSVKGVWATGQEHEIRIACDVQRSKFTAENISIKLKTADGQKIKAVFDPDFNCHVARINKIKRSWKTGYTDIRNYDEFKLRVNNASDSTARIPLLVELNKVANITGLCPILCDAKGVPTGIPIQLSKNWHEPSMGSYLRTFMLIPAKPGKSEYILRIVYGFYGTLPSASHAQLSLVGYKNNGRWDQMAIGCWGETMCLDMDMSCVDVAVTDVRMLMARTGLNGKKWSWTDAGWGGDWLNVLDERDRKLYFSEMKAAYMAHGPCLTEVKYNGAYGVDREVDVQATVRTLRTDDYARTFHTLRYSFDSKVSIENGWLFKMGRSHGVVTPKVAYGDRNGLIEEMEVPLNLKPNKMFKDHINLSGNGPWWFTFPGGSFAEKNTKGNGTRGLIVRSYRASFGGKTYTTPTISLPVHKVLSDGTPNIDMLLVPPRGVTELNPGDKVEMDLEWITLPRIADDYYGPNEKFRQHLTDHPSSWRTVYREVLGNDLKVKVAGGTLLKSYPIIVKSKGSSLMVKIEGGMGFIPIRFEGLDSAKGYKLFKRVNGKFVPFDQSVHGSDFWQTDYDAESNTYKMSFNVPHDDDSPSIWWLKRL